ncbi:hypothetical protein BCR39DRAFT_596958 [Naematelia encephala]|uniref:RING-type domain-containing protein n=1 Tax=Naematelia encephala TaxID=71784 RepID=A0A1Y2BJH8_9TREE|nr:hypothetical protein BCR39DRAFT_596958 [Naematelia encephala]
MAQPEHILLNTIPRSRFLVDVSPKVDQLPVTHPSRLGPDARINGFPIKQATDRFFKDNPHYHPVNAHLWNIELVTPPFEDSIHAVPGVIANYRMWPSVALTVESLRDNGEPAIFDRSTLCENGDILLGVCFQHGRNSKGRKCKHSQIRIPLLIPPHPSPAGVSTREHASEPLPATAAQPLRNVRRRTSSALVAPGGAPGGSSGANPVIPQVALRPRETPRDHPVPDPRPLVVSLGPEFPARAVPAPHGPPRRLPTKDTWPDLFCPICLSIFTEPMLLVPCWHTFCYGCAVRTRCTEQGKSCPICRTKIDDVQADDVKESVINTRLNAQRERMDVSDLVEHRRQVREINERLRRHSTIRALY